MAAATRRLVVGLTLRRMLEVWARTSKVLYRGSQTQHCSKRPCVGRTEGQLLLLHRGVCVCGGGGTKSTIIFVDNMCSSLCNHTNDLILISPVVIIGDRSMKINL